MQSRDPSKARIARSPAAVCGLSAALVTWALWIALGIGHLGLHGWLLELFANFTVQYMAGFAVCVIALTIVRWRKTAIVALFGVALTTAQMAPYFQERVSVTAPEHAFRLVTFNVWFRNEHLARATEFLRSSDADVLVLQEVDLADIAALAQQLPAYPYRATTPISGHGLAIFSRWPMQVEHLKAPRGVTRITRAQVEWRGLPVTLFGAHLNWPLSEASAAARASELDLLAASAAEVSGPVLVAGDFNLTPWSRYFERFIARSALTDCAVGQGLLATWPAQFIPARIRIDHCFASAHWRVHRVEVGPELGSDHLPVIVDLELAARAAANAE